jgi:hypothetical protein
MLHKGRAESQMAYQSLVEACRTQAHGEALVPQWRPDSWNITKRTWAHQSKDEGPPAFDNYHKLLGDYIIIQWTRGHHH